MCPITHEDIIYTYCLLELPMKIMVSACGQISRAHASAFVSGRAQSTCSCQSCCAGSKPALRANCRAPSLLFLSSSRILGMVRLVESLHFITKTSSCTCVCEVPLCPHLRRRRLEESLRLGLLARWSPCLLLFQMRLLRLRSALMPTVLAHQVQERPQPAHKARLRPIVV